MGGAERTARKRRQQQSAGKKAVAQARGGDNKKVIATVIAVVLVAGAIIGGVLWTNASKNETEGQSIAPQTGQAAPAAGVVERREGSVVVTGKPDAKVTIDEYADFLCPHCGEFQKEYGKQIEDKVNAGVLKVRYHMVPLLNQASDPPGYSLESANAALAAADAGKFTQFHDSLFAKQPGEGTRGYDKAQLIQLGQSLGITDPAFANTINSGAYEQLIMADFAKTQQDPNFQGTPTVLSNGQRVDFSDQNWLEKLTGGGQ